MQKKKKFCSWTYSEARLAML